MKKVLLVFAFAFSQLFFSQGADCSTATAITTNGTITVPGITGTYFPTICPGAAPTGADAPTAGVWYSFTPSTSGVVTISSNLPANDGIVKSNETRFSIFSGTCTALTCLSGNDDISATNYLSTVTNVSVAAGTTYYIQWDNCWQATLPFDFTYTFTAVSCLPVDNTTVAIPTLTTTGATITWAIPSVAPASYDVEYGAPGFVQGTGTIVNTPTNSVTLSSLINGGTYFFYIRSNCGGSQSTWIGPYALNLLKTLPYTANFDNAAYNADGFAAVGWGLGNNAAAAQSGTFYYFANSSATAATNAQLYTRALSLTAGENVTLTYFTRLGAATGTPHNLQVFFNTTRSLTGATAVGTPVVVSSATYVQQTATFVAPTTGVYYAIFSDTTPIVAAVTSLRLDTVSLTSTLSVNDIVKSDSNIIIYPNPVSDILNIKSKVKVTGAEIYDMAGRKVNAELNDNSINVSSLEAGSYILSVETAKGKSTQKFIKK